MGISFTDDELKSTSLNYVQYPEQLAVLQQGKAQTLATLDVLLADDNTNKKWTDFYQSVILSYHEELRLKNGQDKSEFVGESGIISAAKREETHYPATPPNVWVNLIPKMVDTQKGLPVGSYTGLIETNVISGVSSAKQVITIGFSDGSDSTQLTNPYTIGGTTIDVDDTTGFAVNQRILVISGSVGMFAKITGIAVDAGFCTGGSGSTEIECVGNGGTWTQPTSGTLTIQVLSPPSSNLPAGSGVSNNASGFSNGEREGTIGVTPERQAVLDIFKGLVDDAVQAWEDFENNQMLPIVQGNEDQKRKSDIQAEISDINAKIAGIDSWQSFPSLKQFVPNVVESRFGDIKLGELETLYNDRSSKITSRISQINIALDNLTQDPNNGSYSGSGVYYDYYDWFNKRCNCASGTLAKYYGTQYAIQVIDQQIANLDSTKDETETLFVITKTTSNGNGTNFLDVESVSGLSITDTIKVIANNQPIVTTNIIGIAGTTLQLGTSISSDYSIENVGRILKEL